jgi:hypothetical protein
MLLERREALGGREAEILAKQRQVDVLAVEVHDRVALRLVHDSSEERPLVPEYRVPARVW